MKSQASSTSTSTEYSVLSTRSLVRAYFRDLLVTTCLAILSYASPLLAAPPKVNFFYPAGGQRGQSVNVTASGEFSNWPVQVWSDRPGLTATCESDKGKLKIDVAADAISGTYWLRLHDGEGAASLRPFVVGTLPEVAEAETNDLPAKPQAVDPRVVVNGKLAKNGDVDGYAMDLKQGQTLVSAVRANSLLGSPFDSLLQICELIERPQTVSRERYVEAFVLAQNHDSAGLDPLLAYTAPRDGRYLVRLFAFPSEPNSTIGFAGGDNYVYRLTLTTGAYIDHALPLAISREASQVHPAGWNLPEGLTVDVSASDSPVTWLFQPDAAGAWPLARVGKTSSPPILGGQDACPKLTLPAAISGRLEADNATHSFAFAGTKGQQIRLRAESRSLGFPTDLSLAVLDTAGQTVAEQDDAERDQRDPVLNVTLPADGEYRATIRDLADRGGLRMAYRLTIETPDPDFDLSLAADSFVLATDKPLEIPLTVSGRDGFAGDVEIFVHGLPAGVTAEPLSIKAAGGNSEGSNRGRRGGNQPMAQSNAKLILKADASVVQPGGGPIRIEGKFKDEDGELVRIAGFPLGLPLTGKHDAVWLTVRK